jgi:serine/threonine protein kinase
LFVFLEQIKQTEVLQSIQPSLLSSISPIKRSQISFNELTIEKEIAEGSYGKVYLGKWNGVSVALKFCKRKGNIDEFQNEVKLMLYVFLFSLAILRIDFTMYLM